MGKLDLFLNCPRCFYVDRRLGVGHPPGYPFNLNIAVDELLKKEFDQYRQSQTPHPIFLEHNLDLVPFDHPDIAQWRDSLHAGVQFHVPGTNLLLTGALMTSGLTQRRKSCLSRTTRPPRNLVRCRWMLNGRLGTRGKSRSISGCFERTDFPCLTRHSSCTATGKRIVTVSTSNFISTCRYCLTKGTRIGSMEQLMMPTDAL